MHLWPQPWKDLCPKKHWTMTEDKSMRVLQGQHPRLRLI